MDKQTQKELLEIVKRNYDVIAEDFDATRKKFLWPELIKLTKAIKNGDKILDVGCGNGRLLEAFKYENINYLGIDTSEQLLNLAKNNYNLPNINFQAGDILDLGKIPQIDFNYVFCIAVLQHIPSRDLQITALKQLKNKVSDNGKIVITIWNLCGQKKYRNKIVKFILLKLIGKNKMDFFDITFDWKNSRGERISKRYYHAFKKWELRKIIKKAGLKIENIHKDKYNIYAILKK